MVVEPDLACSVSGRLQRFAGGEGVRRHLAAHFEVGFFQQFQKVDVSILFAQSCWFLPQQSLFELLIEPNEISS